MPKATEDQAPVEPVITVTLEEFCRRKSETVNRPELLGAFHFVERSAGRAQDSAEAFEKRFDEFVTKPV
jgi:hypothetical protein